METGTVIQGKREEKNEADCGEVKARASKERKKGSRKEKANWAELRTHLLAIPPIFKGQSGAVSHPNLELN